MRIIFLLTVFLSASTLFAEDQDILRTLRPGHPRLLVLDDDMARVREQIKTDPTAKAWFEKLKTAAEQMLTQPPAERVLVGPRLLGVSRQVLARTTLLGGMYRLTGDVRYAERAKVEMLAVAKFQDWHPAHFLDVAEMTNACAIGYDWIFDALSPDERTTIKNAIVELGLKPGLAVYASKKGFSTNTNNWNQVCNGGLTVGALAIADEEPEIAAKILVNARDTIPIAMAQFAPDGGCVEGPGYWAYATRYTCFYIAALQTSLGTDLGFLKTPGLAESGLFRIHSLGPIDRTFNFADAHDGVEPTSQMFYFARAFGRPEYAAHERLLSVRRGNNIEPFSLFWFDAKGDEKDVVALPTAAMFKRINVAFMRSAWNDRNAAFVGFKGGQNGASHAHLDLGTFVYDVDGVRWAMDLGPDDYNLPGYFGGQRYSYYRLRTEGHNTLTIDDENQSPSAPAPIVAFSSDPQHMFAVADLSKGYPKAMKVRRGVQLIGRQLLVQDEIDSADAIDIAWNFHTAAQITVNGRDAELASGGKRLRLHIVEPDATFATEPSDIPPATQSTVPRPQDRERKPGTKLVIRKNASKLRLIVLLSPATEQPADVRVVPLEQWK